MSAQWFDILSSRATAHGVEASGVKTLETVRNSHLEQALPLRQGGAVHGPKVDVRFSTGDNQVGVHRMKRGTKDGVIGALQRSVIIRV